MEGQEARKIILRHVKHSVACLPNVGVVREPVEKSINRLMRGFRDDGHVFLYGLPTDICLDSGQAITRWISGDILPTIVADEATVSRVAQQWSVAHDVE